VGEDRLGVGERRSAGVHNRVREPVANRLGDRAEVRAAGVEMGKCAGAQGRVVELRAGSAAGGIDVLRDATVHDEYLVASTERFLYYPVTDEPRTTENEYPHTGMRARRQGPRPVFLLWAAWVAAAAGLLAGCTPSAHTPPPTSQAIRVGALFSQDGGASHFCTASVVASPRHDLLITAAHCINGGKNGGGYAKDLVFVPGYRDGSQPYGVWRVSKLFVAPQWARSSNPDYDVGFVALDDNGGKNIQDVLGANHVGFNPRFQSLVHVTGYPDKSDAPVTCRNLTAKQSATQLRFSCHGFFGGTSGSPWVARFNPLTRTGTIIGVIGGYQAGGDTDSVSYSSYFGDGIRGLYEEAEAAS
jgi:V8-like Glu-specific endopeptidase